jgi:hypothetical protein
MQKAIWTCSLGISPKEPVANTAFFGVCNVFFIVCVASRDDFCLSVVCYFA